MVIIGYKKKLALTLLALGLVLPNPSALATDDSDYQLWVEVTAYTASIEECGKTDGITASGHIAQEGITIASDDLPFGTKVLIEDTVYVVQDRFGGNYRNRIDIYMDDVSRANTFGRREMLVTIIEEGEE